MARIPINTGSQANDGTGDDLRTAMQNIDTMLVELYAASPVTSQITIEGNKIATNQSNANLNLSANGTGVIEFEGIQISDNQISASRTNDDLILSPAGNGHLVAGALRINGTTISSDDSSAIKINETLNVNTIQSDDSSAVTVDDGLLVTGTLQANSIDTNIITSQDSTAIQINDALNVSGQLTVDTIDTNRISSSDSSAIQIDDSVNISGTLTAGSITGLSVLNNSTQGDGTVTHTGSSAAQPLDTFAISTFRSAKYQVSISDTTNTRFALDELFVTHDGTNAYIMSTGVSSTDSSLVTYSADISSGNVRVLMVPISSDSVTYKFVRTLINV